MIHVVAIIPAKPGMREKVLEAFRANIPAVRAEMVPPFGTCGAA